MEEVRTPGSLIRLAMRGEKILVLCPNRNRLTQALSLLNRHLPGTRLGIDQVGTSRTRRIGFARGGGDIHLIDTSSGVSSRGLTSDLIVAPCGDVFRSIS